MTYVYQSARQRLWPELETINPARWGVFMPGINCDQLEERRALALVFGVVLALSRSTPPTPASFEPLVWQPDLATGLA